MPETALENVKRTIERIIAKGHTIEGARGYQFCSRDVLEEVKELSKIKNMAGSNSEKYVEVGMVNIRQRSVSNAIKQGDVELDIQKKSAVDAIVYSEGISTDAYMHTLKSKSTTCYPSEVGLVQSFQSGNNIGGSIDLMNRSGYKIEEKKIAVNKIYSFTIDYKTILKLQFTTHSKCIKHHMYTTGNADTLGSLCDSKGNVIEVDDKGKNTNIVTKKLAPNKQYTLYIIVKSKTKKNLTVVMKEELCKEEPQKKEKIEIAPWLIGYRGEPDIPKDSGAKIVTYSFEEREKLKKIKSIDWYSYENQTKPNPFTEEYLKGKPFNIGEYGELTDENKRYWVTLGPKVFKPNYSNDGKLRVEEFADYIPCRVDVVLFKYNDKKEKEYVYIECVYSGNIKAHTFDNGIYQTGYPYPNSHSATVEPYAVGYVNGSIVEFTGAVPSDNGTMSKYIVEKLVVYPEKREDSIR